MAYFTKDEYAAKREWAARHQEAQRDTATAHGMTEGQFEFVCNVCKTRHDFHSNATDALTHSESTDYERWSGFATNGYGGEDDAEMVESIGCGEVFTPADAADLPSDFDWYEVFGDDEKAEYGEVEDYMDDAFCRNGQTVDRIDSEITAWLQRVDEKYGTQFAPTGKARDVLV